MRRKSFADMQCPIARSVDAVCDAWSLLILRHAFLGARRFQDFESQLGIAPNTLARRLESLTAAGLLEQRRYHDRPAREAYVLTDKGLDFLPVLLALATWGNRWLAREGVAIQCADPHTGRALEPVMIDRASGRELRAGEVALSAGPGARRELRRALDPPIVMGSSEEAS